MSSSDQQRRRILSNGELFVLHQIQDMYGPQNTEQDVFFSDADEAVIFVRDRNDIAGLAAVLTNLAAMYADGSIASVDELRSDWLSAGTNG